MTKAHNKMTKTLILKLKIKLKLFTGVIFYVVLDFVCHPPLHLGNSE